MAKFINKKTCFIEKTVKLDKSVIVYPNVVIEGTTYIGKGTIIYNGCYIKDSIIGENNLIYSSHIFNSKIGNNNKIGPYANIRENNVIKDDIKIGSFVELKNSLIDYKSKVPHLTYLGDTSVGKNTNIGCGVITANYDGENKHKTVIGDNSFIGSNVNLIAPIKIGDNVFVAAGSTIRKDCSDNEFAISKCEEVHKPNKKVRK